jgi:hypothetical protein
MRFLVAGDSWGVGEWANPHQVLHGGLAQYFKDAGHDVTNVSHGGISNLDIVNRIEIFFDRHPGLTVDRVFVFQTEYHRDYKHWYTHNTTDWDNIESCWIERFYHKLSELAVRHNFQTYLIGGCSDTIWFDDMSTDYPNCHVACQSLVNLICNQDHRINNPVHSWYAKSALEFVKELQQRGIDRIAAMELGFQREAQVREHPEFFYPDGVHPNQRGHLVLYNYLLNLELS